MLKAQHSDWKRFRDFQRKVRQYYLPRERFQHFQNEALDRRRRHALEGDVCLQNDPAKQTQMENWVEFQDFHLTIHERLEKERMEKADSLVAAQNKPTADPKHAHVVRAYVELKASESRLMYQNRLLQWLEQERKAIAVGHMPLSNTQDERSDGQKTCRNGSVDVLRERQSNAGPLPSPIQSEVSKIGVRRPSSQSQKGTTNEAHDQSLGEPVAQQVIPLPPPVQERRSSYSKESTPLRPQKVSRFAKRKLQAAQVPKPIVKSRSSNLEKRAKQLNPPMHGRSQQQISAQQSVYMAIKTKSGRVSKRPERFCPG